MLKRKKLCSTAALDHGLDSEEVRHDHVMQFLITFLLHSFLHVNMYLDNCLSE